MPQIYRDRRPLFARVIDPSPEDALIIREVKAHGPERLLRTAFAKVDKIELPVAEMQGLSPTEVFCHRLATAYKLAEDEARAFDPQYRSLVERVEDAKLTQKAGSIKT